MAGHIINFVTSDGQSFPVELNVARISDTIRVMFENLGEPEQQASIPLYGDITGDTFEKVLEWMQYEQNRQLIARGDENGNADNELDENFRNVDFERLIAIAMAAAYLQIDHLENAACQIIQNRLMDQVPAVLHRNIFPALFL